MQFSHLAIVPSAAGPHEERAAALVAARAAAAQANTLVPDPWAMILLRRAEEVHQQGDPEGAGWALLALRFRIWNAGPGWHRGPTSVAAVAVNDAATVFGARAVCVPAPLRVVEEGQGPFGPTISPNTGLKLRQLPSDQAVEVIAARGHTIGWPAIRDGKLLTMSAAAAVQYFAVAP